MLERAFDDVERWLRSALPVGQAESPSSYLRPSAEPFVGPREDAYTRATTSEGSADLPIERRGLLLQSIPLAIEPKLAQYHRLVLSDVLQARNVR